MSSNRTLLASVLVLSCCSFLAAASPKLEEWADTQGNSFRGEASEDLGPLAVFRTGAATGRRVPFRYLTPESCVRFYKGLQTKPAVADDWAEAKSDVSQDLKGKVGRVRDGKVVPFDVKGTPEPIVYVVFFASSGEGPSWEMMGSSSGTIQNLQRDHPGKLQAVYVGVRHKQRDHLNMATSMNLPYLVAEYYEQPSMSTLKRFAPGEGYGLVALTRYGVPLFAAHNPSKEETAKLLLDVAALLDLLRRDNPKSWPDRVSYLSAVQPVLHANSSAPPLLVGDPLKAEGLRQRKVERVAANLSVDEKGQVTAVEMVPHPSLPEKLSTAIGEALKKGVFVPAVDQGKFVPGTYAYLLEVK